MKDIKWGRPTQYGQHGISHLRSVTSTLHPEEVPGLLSIEGPYQRIFWARLGPGGFIVPHIDTGPFWERWHIPIQPAGWFWENGKYFEPEEDVPFRVHHWLPHAVYNNTLRTRIHLIVDRAIKPPEAPKPGLLVLTEMIPEIQELIDKL